MHCVTSEKLGSYPLLWYLIFNGTKGKPLKQFFVREVPLSKERYYPNTVNNSLCGGFHFQKWIVLPEHFEFASAGFKISCFYIESKHNIQSILVTI